MRGSGEKSACNRISTYYYCNRSGYFNTTGHNVRSSPRLKREDFLLALQTPMQKELLITFGKNIICMDDTHGTNSYDFSLITVLIVDEFGEGCPVFTSKLNAYCTAAIVVTQSDQDQHKIQANIFTTHYGHSITIGHIRLPKEHRFSKNSRNRKLVTVRGVRVLSMPG